VGWGPAELHGSFGPQHAVLWMTAQKRAAEVHNRFWLRKREL
jgi:hypothetical protein